MSVGITSGVSGTGIQAEPKFVQYLNKDMELILQGKVFIKQQDVQVLRDPEDGKIYACFKSYIDGTITPARTFGCVFKAMNDNRNRDFHLKVIKDVYLYTLFDRVELLMKLRGGR